jgi:hypothetical protein
MGEIEACRRCSERGVGDVSSSPLRAAHSPGEEPDLWALRPSRLIADGCQLLFKPRSFNVSFICRGAHRADLLVCP